MDSRSILLARARRMPIRVLFAQAVLAAALVLLLLATQAQAVAQGSPAGGPGAQLLTSPAAGSSSATLEECVTATVQEQRAVDFSAEMTAIPGTMRMTMRIDLEERAMDEAEFHTVTASGLGVWRSSDPKVKVYRYVKQVTNVSAPAVYRGLVRFRWLNAKGHTIKRAERLTSRCLQPGVPAEPAEPGAASGSTTNSSATTPIT
jgi:hypothetical protein